MTTSTITPNTTTQDEAGVPPATPATRQPAGVKKIKIGDFRAAVDSLAWSTNDLRGSTPAEFVQQDVGTRLGDRIAEVEALIPSVPERFADDLNHAQEVIRAARRSIARWTKAREDAQPDAEALPSGKDITVPLCNLIVSPQNVRAADESDVTGLAGLIAAQGLLQNLTVIPHLSVRGKLTKFFEVVAGGRRLRALQLLRQQGKIRHDEPIGCKLRDAEEATAVSLAENSEREQMHPADQFAAFARLIEEGKTVAQVAALFACSELTVTRRLTLAKAAPELLALYREDGMELDQLMALCTVDDHERQIAAWNSAPSYSRSAAALRRLLADEEVSTTDRRVQLVGLAAYEAAGGKIRRDLFSDQADAGWLTDGALLDRLVNDRLQAEAAKLAAEGWSWVEVHPEFDHTVSSLYSTAPRQRRAMTAEEAAHLEALHAESVRLADKFEAACDNDEPEDENERAALLDPIEAELQAADDAYRAAEEQLLEVSPAVMALAGAVVSISRVGELEVRRAQLRKADSRAIKAALSAPPAAGQGGTADDGATSAGTEHTGKAPSAADLSDSLARRLSAHRTFAVQAMLADNAHVALAAVVHALVPRLVEDQPFTRGTALGLSAKPSRVPLVASAPEAQASRAVVALDERINAWRDRLPGDPGKQFAWLVGLPASDLLDLLALCAALAADGLTGVDREHPIDALAGALGLDMADWFEATGETYLKHIPKAKIIAAVTEAKPGSDAAALAGMKKAELVAQAERDLQGSRWLPPMLRAKAARD